MKRKISDKGIYAQADRLYSDKEASEYRYSLVYQGNTELEEMTAEEVREVIACLQHALDVNEKGGAS